MLAATLAAWLGPARSAYAEPPAPAEEPEPTAGPTVGDPYGGHPTWLLPSPAVQADQDPQVSPAASGSIFVPTMTDPVGEPSYVVMQDGEEVGRSDTGRKTFVQQGVYRVLVGTGTPAEMLEFEATVVDGKTTFIPVEWGGLLVYVVDERGTAVRGSYELVRLPERDYVGMGLGADIARGERLTTWLVRPGKYMLLSAGESYQARKNFITVRVPPGELVQVRLVLDEQTGAVLGGGEVLPTGQASAAKGPWKVDVVLGGSFAFNRADNVVGKANRMSFDLGGFIEAIGQYRDDQHLAYARLNIEEQGTLVLPDRPYLATVDELNLDILYVLRALDWLGPYARASVETHVLPGIEDFGEARDVRKLDGDGRVLAVERGKTWVELSETFDPVELRYGTGLRFDVAPDYWLSFSSLLGVGGRHVFTRSLFSPDDDKTTTAYDIRRVDDVLRYGAEFSLTGELSVTRWVRFNAELDLFTPFDVPEQTLVDFRGTVTLRLASFASLSYTIRVKQDPEIVSRTQFDQGVLLRFAYKLL